MSSPPRSSDRREDDAAWPLYRVGGNVITDEKDVCLMKAANKIDHVIARATRSEYAERIAALLNEADSGR